eukprot:1143657-Pelagomonas_calceolata.AAC.3
MENGLSVELQTIFLDDLRPGDLRKKVEKEHAQCYRPVDPLCHIIMQIDMSNLKKDPRLREKLQLDNPEKPQPSFTALYFDWINKKMKRNEDY